ncbi:unnamed protein product [Acanthoscelides obtectus]|uniref:Chitin-binding type-2 domain-containing protein n=1 Tax=Acanthoscelides obtectus TaxID=200917 RepID=A0A9P0K5K9_ACAOB|nr:unnamed protein product [Acanthoscelides obtectus]CAK1667382.1 hypothetical protein AOBTE_LOCUS25812 [Acanthoscelides obtectus]
MMHFDNVLHLFLVVLGITVLRAEIDGSQGNKCSMDGIFPDRTDCSRFYMCSAGKKTVFQCPGQLRFNPNLLVCDWPVNVVCLKDIPTKRTSLEPRISGNRASTKSDTQYVATTEEVTSRTAHVSTDPHTVSVAGKDESVYSDVKGANIEHVTDATHTTSINKDKISIYKTKATPATTGKDEIVDRDSEHSRTTPSVDNGTSLEHVSTRETTLLVSTEYATAIPPIGLKTAAIKDESNYVTHVGTSVVTPIETITSTIEENTSTDGIASNVGNVTGKASVTTVKQSAITTGENKAVGQDIAYFSTASLADSGSTSKFVGTEQVTLATEYAANIPHTSFKSSEGKEKPVTSYISQTNEGVTVAIHSETTTTPVKEEETSTHGLPPSTEETDNTATEETATPRTKNVATNEGDMTATPADSTTEQAVSTGKSTLSTENITIVPHTDFKTTAVKEETVLNYIASTNIGNFIVTTTSTKREETTTNDPIQNIGATATTNLYDGADGENVNTATYAETSNFTDHVTTEQATLATDPTTVPHISLITTATKEAPASNGVSVTLVNQSEDTNNSDKEETSNDGITNTGITTRETSTIAIESNKSSTPYATTDKNSGYSYTTLSQGTGTTEHEVITKHASLTTEYIITPPHFDLSTTVRTKESVSSDSTITDAEDVKVDTYITATTTSFEEEPLADTLTSDVENIEDVFYVGRKKNNAEFVSTDIRSTSVEDVTVTTHSEDATTPAQNVVTTVFLHTDSITTTVTENPVTNDVISTTVNNFTMHTDTTNTPLAKKEYALGSNDETIADEATNSMIDEVIERFNNVETTSMSLEVRLHDKPGDTTDFPSHTENALIDANEIMTADMDRSHEDKVLTVTKSVKMEYIDTNIDVISGDKMLSKANKHTDATYENVAAFKGDSKTGIVTKIPTDDSEIIVKDNKTFIKRLASTTKSIAIVSPVQNKDISLDDGRELSTSAGTEKYVDTTYNTVSPDNTITHKMTHSHLPQDMTNIFDSSASNEVVQQAKAISIEEEIEAALGNLDASGDAVIQGTIATENTSTVIEKAPNEEGSEQEEVVTTKKYTSLVTEEAPSQTSASKNKDVMEDIAINETDSNRVKANEERTEKLVVEENTAKNTERKAFKKEEETMTKEIDLELVEESLEHFSSSSVNTMIDESGSSMTENTDKDGDNEEQGTVDKADKGGVVIKEKFVAFNESGKVIIDQGDSDDSTVTEGIVRELSAPVADKTVDRQNLDSVSNIHEDEVIIDKQEIVEENKILTSQEESESDSKVNEVYESSDNEADRQKLINVNHAAMSKNPDIVESTIKTGEVKKVNTLEEKRSGDGNVDTLDIVGKITSVSEGNHYDDDAVEGSSSQKSVALGKEKKIVHGNIEEIAEKTKLEQTVVVTELPIAPNSITEHGESLYDEISSLTGTILNDKADEISTILGKGSKSDVPVTTENKFSSQEIPTVVDRERASISKQIIKNDMQDNNEAKVTLKVQKSVETYTIVDEIAELENPQRDVSATMSNISKEQSDNAIDKRWSLVHRNSTNPSDTIPESDNGDINIGTDKSDNELKVADVEKSTKLKKTVKVGVAETNKRVFYDDKYPEIDITDVIEKQSETKNIKQQLNENPTDTIRTSFEKEAPKNVEDIESIETILSKPEDVLTIADGKNSKLLTTINTKNNAESETIESVFEDNLNDISAVGSRRKSGDSNVGGILNVEEVKTDKIVDEILDSTGNARIVNEDVLNGTKHQAAIQDSVSIDSTESRKFNIQDIRDIVSIRSGNTASEETTIRNKIYTDSNVEISEESPLVMDVVEYAKSLNVEKVQPQKAENILPDTVASTDQYEEKDIVVVNGFVEKNKDETANVTGKYFENVQKGKLDKISGEIFRENMENAKVNTLADNIVQIAEKVKKNQTVETNAHITNITPVKKAYPLPSSTKNWRILKMYEYLKLKTQ